MGKFSLGPIKWRHCDNEQAPTRRLATGHQRQAPDGMGDGKLSVIQGLGLDSLEARDTSEGMVGQFLTRRATGLILQLIRQGEDCLAHHPARGPTGHRQDGTRHGISKSLGAEMPFTSEATSKLFSLDMSKTEALTQAFSRAIGFRIKEEAEMCSEEAAETRDGE
jgi:RuvB-like protein 2